MCEKGTSLATVCLVIGAEICMLKRNVSILNVIYLNVTKDILELALSLENIGYVSVWTIADINMPYLT